MPGCREKLRAGKSGGVEFALPDWPERGEKGDAASGSVERDDGRGSRAAISWDVDPRRGAVTEAEARATVPVAAADALPAQVAGHPAVLLRGMRGAALVWRCEPSTRLFRLSVGGPRSPEIANLAAHVRCHAERMLTNGDVPAAANSSLGSEWRYASRGRGTISWIRDDAVLTFFAGQGVPGPRDAAAAQLAAPGWLAAAGLTGITADFAEPAPGPQSHPALRVRGEAKLDGQPVRWTMLFWRCLQRQKSFAAVVFSRGTPDESALLAARCHA